MYDHIDRCVNTLFAYHVMSLGVAYCLVAITWKGRGGGGGSADTSELDRIPGVICGRLDRSWITESERKYFKRKDKKYK